MFNEYTDSALYNFTAIHFVNYDTLVLFQLDVWLNHPVLLAWEGFVFYFIEYVYLYLLA